MITIRISIYILRKFYTLTIVIPSRLRPARLNGISVRGGITKVYFSGIRVTIYPTLQSMPTDVEYTSVPYDVYEANII